MPDFKQFATPHCHPASLDSASSPEAFAKREVELGTGAVTCTDHGTLAAAQQVYEQAKKRGLTPIIGLEAYFRDDACPILQGLGVPRTDTVPRGMDKERWAAEHPDGSYIDYIKYQHLTMHFMDYDAYLCAVRLLSKADARAEQHGSERKPLFDWAAVEELASHNVTVGSSCLIGMAQRHLLDHQNVAAAKAYFERLRHLFQDRFYVEVFPHVLTHNYVKKVLVDVEAPDGTKTQLRYYYGKKLRTNRNEPEGLTAEELADRYDPGTHTHLREVKNYRAWEPTAAPYRILHIDKKEDFIPNECTPTAPDGDVQRGGNLFVLGMAKKLGVKVLISDDSHFAHPEEKVVQDVRLAQAGDWRMSNSYHRFSSAEAWAYFQATLPGTVKQSHFEGWIDNSQEWAARFKDFKLDTTPCLPTKFYPKDSLGYTKELILRYARLEKRKPYLDRLRTELEILHRNGEIDLLPYFHIDEEMCRLHEHQGQITGPGRGSAAGLLVCYLLGITHVDPIKHGLSLERFITLDRIKAKKLPDIDQDLPSRDLLVGYATDVVEVVMDDDSKHVLPEDLQIETDRGIMTVLEAAASGAEIKPWWLHEMQNP